MDDAVSDILQCEEQLRTTLHCDDKEKVPSIITPFSLLFILSVLTNIINTAAQEVVIFTKRVPEDRPETTGWSLSLHFASANTFGKVCVLLLRGSSSGPSVQKQCRGV